VGITLVDQKNAAPPMASRFPHKVSASYVAIGSASIAACVDAAHTGAECYGARCR
jgi:hypothetical protein